ncbi:hypothetical protein LSTR_LSTR016858 [Laodelphax striatellus]|uniref:Uncharacterized protein n=1 Tax=Laodelphax striatellus TaxID=195883 RepID=A0A482WL67_LAOST|nr:hypothetical protein LSTR_LSTR016858 [Laodelphax striatellus]
MKRHVSLGLALSLAEGIIRDYSPLERWRRGAAVQSTTAMQYWPCNLQFPHFTARYTANLCSTLSTTLGYSLVKQRDNARSLSRQTLDFNRQTRF